MEIECSSRTFENSAFVSSRIATNSWPMQNKKQMIGSSTTYRGTGAAAGAAATATATATAAAAAADYNTDEDEDIPPVPQPHIIKGRHEGHYSHYSQQQRTAMSVLRLRGGHCQVPCGIFVSPIRYNYKYTIMTCMYRLFVLLVISFVFYFIFEFV